MRVLEARRIQKTRGLSARACDRILKVSRTIADLAQEESINSEPGQEFEGIKIPIAFITLL